jgi:hypothetical protein
VQRRIVNERCWYHILLYQKFYQIQSCQISLLRYEFVREPVSDDV